MLEAFPERERERERDGEEKSLSRDALAALIANLPGMAYRSLAKECRTLRYVSDGCFVLTGYPPEALLDDCNVSFGDLIHPDDRKRVHEEVWKAVTRGMPYRTEYRIRTAFRGKRWVRDQGRGVYADDGSLVAIEGYVTDISAGKTAEEKIRYRRRLESLITSVSTEFINLSFDEIDVGINGVLESIGDFMDVDRSYVLEFSGDRSTVTMTHEWCAGSVEGTIDRYRCIPLETFPLARDVTLNGEVFAVTRVSDLPEAYASERKAYQATGARSFILVPMTSDGEVVGALGFTSVRHETSWPEDAILLLRIVGEMIANALRRKQSEEILREREERLRLAATLFENTPEGVVVTDARNRITAVNPAFTEITGYAEEEVLGRDPSLLSSGRHASEFYDAMWDRLNNGGKWQGEIWNRRKNGEIYPEWVSISAVKDADGNLRHWVAVFSDITDRLQAEEYMRRQAHYDTLTDLPNRDLFLDRLQQAMAVARRRKKRVALLTLDLDRFKLVNDSLGHRRGDKLLRKAALRIRSALRRTDTVARQGGDEFTVILPELARYQDAENIVRKILDTLAHPFQVDGHETFVTASLGLTIFPDDATEVEELLRNAEAAMYKAKSRGRNSFRFFTARMNAESRKRLKLEAGLRRALARDEFALAYQPIMDIRSGRLSGAEALLRWSHPDLGPISPATFIPLAEESGLIVPIGEWVLRTACEQAWKWLQGGRRCPVSVNVSGRQFEDEPFGDTVRRVLADTGLPPDMLTLEITESVLMNDAEPVIEVLKSLREMGVGFSVDDFGTGFSSLSYLRRLPVNTLKIDRSFVDEIADGNGEAVLVNAIIAIARGLNLLVVGEGVETREQLEFLREHGCHRAQGFYFSRAVLPRELESFMDSLGRRRGL